jgi:hypothetical protein
MGFHRAAKAVVSVGMRQTGTTFPPPRGEPIMPFQVFLEEEGREFEGRFCPSGEMPA